MPTVCQWAIDSGASHHMCNRRSSFTKIKKLKTPIGIRLGDNSIVHATHHGVARITPSFKAYALYTPTFKFSLLSISTLDGNGFFSTFGLGTCQIRTHGPTDTTGRTIIQGSHRNGIYFIDGTYNNNLNEIPTSGLLSAEDSVAPPPLNVTAAGHELTPPSEEVIPDPEVTYEDDYVQNEKDVVTLRKAARERPVKRRRVPHKSLKSSTPTRRPALVPATTLSTEESRRWHRRLAHLHPAAMRSLIDGLSHDDQLCDVCLKAKQKRKIVRIPVKPTTRPYELVHSDLCGPFSTPSLSGKRYFIVFVDDYSRYTEAFLLPDKKAETCTGAFQQYQAQARARGYEIKRFRCDNGKGEYDNNLFRSILRLGGITFEPSPPYAQHKNGVSERTIGAITEKARAMIVDSQVPHEFWGEAVMTATYLHRRTPHRFLNGKSPHEVLNGYNVNPAPPPAPIHHLRRFGCRAYRLIPEEQRSDKKLGERSKMCMMVGYVHHTTKLWKLYDPEFKKVMHCSDVEFDEDVNCYVSCPTTMDDGIDPFGLPQREPIRVEYYDESSALAGPRCRTATGINREAGELSAAEEADNASQESAAAEEADKASEESSAAEEADNASESAAAEEADDKNSAAANLANDIDCFVAECTGGFKRKRRVLETPQFINITRGTTKQKSAKASLNIRFGGDPVTVKEALHLENPHHKDWRAAMQEEWASIKLNNTFGLPDGRRVDGQKPISSKWVFKTKTESRWQHTIQSPFSHTRF
jgi:hypothetical protein